MRFIDRIKMAFGLATPSTVVSNSVNTMQVYPTFKQVENGRRYTNTDDVYSVIKLLATTSALVPLYAYDVVDDKLKKQLQRMNVKEEPYFRKQLQKKALEELPENDRLQMLLENPGYANGKYEFFEALYSFLYIQGECLLWKEITEFGPNKGQVYKLHFLYPQYVILKVTDKYPYTTIAYDYLVNGQLVMQNIPAEEVIHIKYFNPVFNIWGEELRGLSPLKVLSSRLERMDSNINVSIAQLQNGGVPGIVTEKNIDALATETSGTRKDNFYRYMQSQDNAGMPYFGSGDLSYIALGLRLVDMDTVNLEKIDFKKLCNAYSVSDVLFNNGEASTESNVKEMMKRLYTNSTLPNVMRVRDALNKGLVTTL